LQTALGEKWKANPLFTEVIAEDGTVIYRKEGKLTLPDLLALRRVDGGARSELTVLSSGCSTSEIVSGYQLSVLGTRVANAHTVIRLKPLSWGAHHPGV